MDKQRHELARVAARMICEQGLRDFGQAKARAAHEVLGHDRGQWPSNQELADAVMEHLRLFEAAQWSQRLRHMRMIALEAMILTAEFSPRAVGAVVTGLATQRSPVILHLFCPFDEALDFFLGDRNIPFDDEEVAIRHPDGREIRRPSCVFMAEDTEVQLVVFAQDDLRWAPLSHIDARPMERWSQEQLEATINDAGDAEILANATTSV